MQYPGPAQRGSHDDPATGKALVGSIGSDVLMSYAVIGETVNLASRPDGANKGYGGRILTTETTVKMAGDALKAREIDRVILVGQNRPRRSLTSWVGAVR